MANTTSSDTTMATTNPNGPDSPTASNKTVPHDSAVDNALLVSHNTLDEDFIKEIVEKAVDDVIQDATYSHDATNVWANKIAELLVRTLVNVDRDNKYIGTSITSRAHLRIASYLATQLSSPSHCV